MEKEKLLKELLPNMGENIVILSPFYTDYGYNCIIGDNTFINHNAYLTDGTNITIGKNCFIGPNCGMYTVNHPLAAEERNKGYEITAPISIGDNVWIGADVTILPGVAIGDIGLGHLEGTMGHNLVLHHILDLLHAGGAAQLLTLEHHALADALDLHGGHAVVLVHGVVGLSDGDNDLRDVKRGLRAIPLDDLHCCFPPYRTGKPGLFAITGCINMSLSPPPATTRYRRQFLYDTPYIVFAQ